MAVALVAVGNAIPTIRIKNRLKERGKAAKSDGAMKRRESGNDDERW